ncbi:MAG TPA: glycosyltransferase family 4 protein [Vicinamibacterales bacterium]|nr:glycosyltransferase family 4 protein [Vicinamibacterales bacterium]
MARLTAQLQVALVAPSLRILGGQAVQADRLLREWTNDPDVHAWLVPHNPRPPVGLRWATRVKYLRTLVTEATYLPLLFLELRRADVVHIFSASYSSFLLAPLPAILVARALGKPVVLNYRSGEAPDHLRRSAIARWALRRVDRNAVPSRFLRDVFATFDIDSTIVANVIALERFPFRPRMPLRPRLLSTRNLDPLYNVACTLRAFAQVQRVHPEASLTLVGDGSERERLETLARALALRNVTFAGRIDPSRIAAFYDEHDIYVQTPNLDNMPASVLEAFASGLPVVSTEAGGVPAILRHGEHGLLAPVGDDDAVARHLLHLLADPDHARALALAAYQTLQAYTWPHVRSRWVALYRSVLARGANQPAAVET